MIQYRVSPGVAAAALLMCCCRVNSPLTTRLDIAPDTSGFDVRVNAYRSSTQSGAALTDDGAGGYILSWQSRRQHGGMDALCARRVDSNGELSAQEVRLHDDRIIGRWRPVIARAGHVLWAAWIGQEHDGPRVSARRFDLELNPLGDEFLVDPSGPTAQDDIALSGHLDGSAVLAWTAPTPTGRRLTVRGLAADGATLGAPQTISTAPAGDDRSPALATDGQGRVVCVWSRTDHTGVPAGLVMRRVAANGKPLGDQHDIIRDAGRSHIEPAIAIDDDGRWHVAWLTSAPDGHYGVTFMQGDMEPFDMGSPRAPSIRVVMPRPPASRSPPPRIER